MDEREGFRRVMKQLRNHVDSSENREKLQELANIIGDRRHRDFLDYIARLEYAEGWASTVQLLIHASNSKYRTPAGMTESSILVEPMKYREMIFTLFSCNGLEPVNISTASFLETIAETESMIDARNRILQTVTEAAHSQIMNGDTLFFRLDDIEANSSESLIQVLKETTNKKLDAVVFLHRNNEYDVSPLWYTQAGMNALSDLGIKGKWLPRERIDLVLSVLQVSQHTRQELESILDSEKRGEPRVVHPSHNDYNLLIKSIINHNLNCLVKLGSKHAVRILNPLLNDAISVYNRKPSSSSYASILSLIRAHVRIRSQESLLHLSQLIATDNPRLTTPAITAIGNFYCQAAASILTDRICSCTNKQDLTLMLAALQNIWKNLPEVETIVRRTIDSTCRNRGQLKRLLVKHSNEDTEQYDY